VIPLDQCQPGTPVTINTLNGRQGVIEAVIVLVKTQEGSGEYRAFLEELALVAASVVEAKPVSHHAARDMGFTGNVCGRCSSSKMVRTGPCETCQECGTTSGGCG
jgi:hypothetical protein